MKRKPLLQLTTILLTVIFIAPVYAKRACQGKRCRNNSATSRTAGSLPGRSKTGAAKHNKNASRSGRLASSKKPAAKPATPAKNKEPMTLKEYRHARDELASKIKNHGNEDRPNLMGGQFSTVSPSSQMEAYQEYRASFGSQPQQAVKSPTSQQSTSKKPAVKPAAKPGTPAKNKEPMAFGEYQHARDELASKIKNHGNEDRSNLKGGQFSTVSPSSQMEAYQEYRASFGSQPQQAVKSPTSQQSTSKKPAVKPAVKPAAKPAAKPAVKLAAASTKPPKLKTFEEFSKAELAKTPADMVGGYASLQPEQKQVKYDEYKATYLKEHPVVEAAALLKPALAEGNSASEQVKNEAVLQSVGSDRLKPQLKIANGAVEQQFTSKKKLKKQPKMLTYKEFEQRYRGKRQGEQAKFNSRSADVQDTIVNRKYSEYKARFREKHPNAVKPKVFPGAPPVIDIDRNRMEGLPTLKPKLPSSKAKSKQPEMLTYKDFDQRYRGKRQGEQAKFNSRSADVQRAIVWKEYTEYKDRFREKYPNAVKPKVFPGTPPVIEIDRSNLEGMPARPSPKPEVFPGSAPLIQIDRNGMENQPSLASPKPKVFPASKLPPKIDVGSAEVPQSVGTDKLRPQTNILGGKPTMGGEAGRLSLGQHIELNDEGQ